MTQSFFQGNRLPVTVLDIPKQTIVQLKDDQKDGYHAVQVAIGQKDKPLKKSLAGHLKSAKLKKPPLWLREIKVSPDDLKDLKPGDQLPVKDIIKQKDIINITAVSKGKGFSGVIKRHNFKGAARTHGQTRQRHGGSIGRTTTPGRVLPGKKMPGRMGNQKTTIINSTVLKIDPKNNTIWVKGSTPGARNQLVALTVTKQSSTKDES